MANQVIVRPLIHFHISLSFFFSPKMFPVMHCVYLEERSRIWGFVFKPFTLKQHIGH